MYEINILETNKQLQDIAINTEDTATILVDGSQKTEIVTPGDVVVTGTVNMGQNSLNVNITGGLISVVTSNSSVGPTGAPVPADATYVGFRNGSGDLTPVTIGQQAMADSLPVAIASDQSPIPISGTVTITDPSVSLVGTPVPTYAQYIGFRDTGGNLAPVILTAAGALPVDASGTIQPVSGTVAVTQSTSPWVDNVSQFGGSAVVTGTGASGAGIPRVTVSNDSNVLATQSGTWNINNVSGTVSLPTGASTSANQTNGSQKSQIVDGSGTVIGPAQTVSGSNYLPVVLAASATPGAAIVARSIQVAGSDGTNAQTLSTDSTGKININTVAGTVTVTGTVTANAGTNLNTSALNLETTQTAFSAKFTSSTSTVTSVASSATNVTLLASNASRKGASFFNDSTKVAYIKLGTTASLTSYTVQVAALGFFVINNNPNYTGQIDALWSAANGNMRITELT